MINYGHQCNREAHYTQTNDFENTVNVILTDYQCDYNGGNGVLRYYIFKPSKNRVYGYTYSTWSGQYEDDGDSSKFNFYYNQD